MELFTQEQQQQVLKLFRLEREHPDKLNEQQLEKIQSLKKLYVKDIVTSSLKKAKDTSEPKKDKSYAEIIKEKLQPKELVPTMAGQPPIEKPPDKLPSDISPIEMGALTQKGDILGAYNRAVRPYLEALGSVRLREKERGITSTFKERFEKGGTPSETWKPLNAEQTAEVIKDNMKYGIPYYPPAPVQALDIALDPGWLPFQRLFKALKGAKTVATAKSLLPEVKASVETSNLAKVLKEDKDFVNIFKGDIAKAGDKEIVDFAVKYSKEPVKMEKVVLESLEDYENIFKEVSKGKVASATVAEIPKRDWYADLFLKHMENKYGKGAMGKSVSLVDEPTVNATVMGKTDDLSKVAETSKIGTAEKLGDVGKITGSKTLSLRAKVQDAQIHIRKLQDQPGIKLNEANNRYNAEGRYYGRLQTKLEDTNKSFGKLDKQIIETSKKHNIPDVEFQNNVYRYLIAKHTPERNAVLGTTNATGITNETAQKILDDVDKLPYKNDLKKAADGISDVNKKTLDLLLDGQVINKETHTFFRERYKYHVPLQRILDDTENVVEVLNSGKGFNVTGTGIKGAKGSERPIADIMENVYTNVIQAAIKAEKNIVNLSTLKFARDNKELGIFDIFKPKIIGKTSKGKPIYERVDTFKEPIIGVREEGNQLYVKVKDPVLAEAYKAIGVENVPKSVKFINAFTRLYSSLATRYNPEFIASNIFRDTQEMAVFLGSQKGIGLRGAVKAVGKEPGNIKDIMNYMWGDGKSPGAKVYREMIEEGGTTGGMALSTRGQVQTSLDRIRKINRSKPRQAADMALRRVDELNQVFEDATRLAAYKQGLASGLSKKQAATLAKESTINFNRKGKYGPMINAFYMFANASMQGSVKMMKALKNPKVFAAVNTTVGGGIWAVRSWNDQINPEWRNKVSKWDLTNNLPIFLDDGDSYVTLPFSWGLKPLANLWGYAYDVTNGYDIGTPQEIMSDTFTSFWDAYNPMGGSNFVQSIAPSIIDVPLDIYSNVAWHGGQVYPEMSNYRGASDYEKYFRSTKESMAGEGAIEMTKLLGEKTGIEISPESMLYAIQQYSSGAGKFLTRTVKTVASIGKGEIPSVKDTPILNRFYKSIPKDRIENMKQYKELDTNFYQNLISNDANEKINRSRRVNDTIEQLKSTDDGQEKKAILKSLIESDPKALDSFIRALKYYEKGLDRIERVMMDLSPEKRAIYVKHELDKFKDKDEKLKRFADLNAKGVVTEDVLIELVKKGWKIK